MDIVKVSAVCLIAAVLAKVIQPTNRDLAALLSISAVIFSAFAAIDGITEVFSGSDGILGGAGVATGYVRLAFKALGICYLTELCSSSCRDCGETALGAAVDLSGRVAISLLMLPLIRQFIEIIRTVLER